MDSTKTYPSNIELEEIPCPLDGCTEYDVVVVGQDILYKVPGEFQVVRCRECGLMRTSPRPTLETIGTYYPSDYQPYLNTRAEEQIKIQPSLNMMKRWIKRFINYGVDVLPSLEPSKMLEIGCASGSFMRKMRQVGWEVEGIEPDEVAAESARQLGFSVYTGSVETAPESPEIYDLIVGWMVIEHLHNPRQALGKLSRWTKPGGWLVFSVPNAGSYEMKLFKQYWYALQVPTHTFHYTPETITKMLNMSGWEVEKIFFQRNLVNVFASFGYWLNSRGIDNVLVNRLKHFSQVPWRVHQLLYPLAWLLSLFGQTGRMTIWAKRKDD